jgi:hypothetical protein
LSTFLNIGITFIFGSFGIRTGMAGPVIATGFLRRREAGRLPFHDLDKTLAIERDRKLKLESKI